jgi:peptidoglycan/LPS O-acetylase OafA/YrhL
VQQLVTAQLGGRAEWWMNAALSLPVVVALAALSWHLVEKPALRLKGSPPVLLRWLSPDKTPAPSGRGQG